MSKETGLLLVTLVSSILSSNHLFSFIFYNYIIVLAGFCFL